LRQILSLLKPSAANLYHETSENCPQKMVLNVCGYDVTIHFLSGCKQALADTLSRASVQNDDSGAYEEFQEINVVFSVSDERRNEFQRETKIDPELQA